ncbi:universal stress protein [Schlesneria paludicola]|uniref:universal stress protein n=1 Tax=Schlesneria paludicola TaxID=360056 RepID=UPI00029B0CD7|nr:universal stress protein [Schlesneria paludicola]
MRVSVRRILFTTDFSVSAHDAQDYAVALARQFDSELHALHIVTEPLPLPGPHGTWILPEQALPGMIKDAQTQLDRTMSGVLVNAAKLVCAVRVGNAVREIVKYAEEQQIDLIVIGTHGRTGLSHLLIGSVAEKLIRLAKCPVLSVHPQKRADSKTSPTSK